jgi:hypothetical protein
MDRLFISLVLCVLICCTGCISQMPFTPAYQVVPVTPTLAPIPTPPPDHGYWLQIDPISDVHTGGGTSPTTLVFNITGTTNLPVRELLLIESYRDEVTGNHMQLTRNDIVYVENTGGSANTFSSPVNISNMIYGGSILPGEYRVVVSRIDPPDLSNTTSFFVVGKDPLPRLWIHIDPFEPHAKDAAYTITGTTNLPPGSVISLSGGAPIHSCTRGPGIDNSGTVCGGDCAREGFGNTTRVTRDPQGNSTWSYTINTKDWCIYETYTIRVSKNDWDNVTPDIKSFRFEKI